ncbi:MAG: hypothetical protein HRT89_02220 [Lentisphaeria bacterium]|nr:hypothetical protein [Lentisphaeria bacterium]NQZ66863.1 hypothetical protein [Lentisphaeria bacterium]
MTEEDESKELYKLHNGDLKACLDTLHHQFSVLQSRSQLLLSLATITLTITGFSGPAIAKSHNVAAIMLSIGVVIVLASIIVMLIGTLRVNWITQLVESNSSATSLIRALQYRNKKTRWYIAELFLIVIGLSFYVVSLVIYLLKYA